MAAEWKRAAAEAAARLVRDDMLVGLGSGTTMAQVVRELSRVGSKATFIPSSSAIQRLADGLGLRLGSLDERTRLDLAIDGADEVDPDFNMVKGRGGAHTREKILAHTAERVVIVVDRTKLVERLGERAPVPVEVIPFAHKFVMGRLKELGSRPELRATRGGSPFVTDDGNYIIDAKFEGIGEPAELERAINSIPGVIENGIFVGLPDLVLVGHEGGCAALRSRKDFFKIHAQPRSLKCEPAI